MIVYRMERGATAAPQSVLRPRHVNTPGSRLGTSDTTNPKVNDDSKEHTADQIKLQRLSLNRKLIETGGNATPSKPLDVTDSGSVVRRLISSSTPLNFSNNLLTSTDENKRITCMRKMLPSQKSDTVVNQTSKNSSITSEITPQKVYRTTGELVMCSKVLLFSCFNFSCGDKLFNCDDLQYR